MSLRKKGLKAGSYLRYLQEEAAREVPLILRMVYGWVNQQIAERGFVDCLTNCECPDCGCIFMGWVRSAFPIMVLECLNCHAGTTSMDVESVPLFGGLTLPGHTCSVSEFYAHWNILDARRTVWEKGLAQ
jgi:hypothetical protein